MSSYLMCYSVLYELNTLEAGRSRLMCGVIVVDAKSFRSTSHGHDAYVHDHCLRYHHNYALFYQLIDPLRQMTQRPAEDMLSMKIVSCCKNLQLKPCS